VSVLAGGSARGSGWPAGGLVVAGCVEGELAQEFAGGGVDDADAPVLDEQEDVGSGVGPADAEVVERAAVAEGDAAGLVDDVAADAVVGVGGAVAGGGFGARLVGGCGGGPVAATTELLALLDGYRPGQLAPMQRAERDLARARLSATSGGPDPARRSRRRSPACASTPPPTTWPMACSTMPSTCSAPAAPRARRPRPVKPAPSPSGWAASRCSTALTPFSLPARAPRSCDGVLSQLPPLRPRLPRQTADTIERHHRGVILKDAGPCTWLTRSPDRR
jgi:hypothetical protein